MAALADNQRRIRTSTHPNGSRLGIRKSHSSCYLMYGAYASILLHWFFNVYFEAFALGSDLLGGVFVTIEGIIGLLTFIAGALGIGSGIIWLSSRRNHPGETTYTIQGSSPVVTGEGALYHRQVD